MASISAKSEIAQDHLDPGRDDIGSQTWGALPAISSSVELVRILAEKAQRIRMAALVDAAKQAVPVFESSLRIVQILGGIEGCTASDVRLC